VKKRNFRDKVVVITGASGGMGSAFARRFSEAGARICLLDIPGVREKSDHLAGEIGRAGGRARVYDCDVTDEGQCRMVMEQVIRDLGGIDLLINNAGITHRSAFIDTSPEVVRRVIEVSLFGSINCTSAAIGSIVERNGLVVGISSAAGFAPLLGRTGYCAAKHGMHGFFDTLRAELHGTGTDVLLLCPGFTRTSLSHSALDADGSITKHPKATVGKIAEPEEVAKSLFRAARARKRMVVLTGTGKLAHLISRISPRLYEVMMRRSLKGELERG
jgi:NAD(P)-dependent dehydrogenase (short-subunit alcohol dehydrogenase family)